MSFQIIRNDITKVKADIIVNTANPKPTYGSGTDSAIYKAAGEKELLSARKKIGNIARGDVAVTPAFNLDAKYIIHTVGPVWDGGDKGELDILRSCYEKALSLALELKCKSIAFPLIATGVYDFPKDKALQIAMSTIQAFLLENNMKVILVVFDRKAFELSGKVIDNIREYVDSNYVKTASKKEYFNYSVETYDDAVLDYCEENKRNSRLLREQSRDESGQYIDIKDIKSHSEKSFAKKIKIDDLISSSDKTFQEKLFEIIDERGLTSPQVYKNYISKQVFSKIQSDKEYHPNKFTAIALCLSLHLDVEQTQDLIGRAGWTLSPSNKADLVVKGCILNHEYNIVKINCILFDFNCLELQKIK